MRVRVEEGRAEEDEKSREIKNKVKGLEKETGTEEKEPKVVDEKDKDFDWERIVRSSVSNFHGVFG